MWKVISLKRFAMGFKKNIWKFPYFLSHWQDPNEKFLLTPRLTNKTLTTPQAQY